MDLNNTTMESKYYTPDESEFHKGFEYEIPTYNPQNDIGHDEEAVWNKVRFPDPFVGWQADKIKGARVKYLDKEDIESLGFNNAVGENFFYKNHPLITSHSNEYFLNERVVGFGDYEMCYYKDCTLFMHDYNRECIFSGTIKNKSELLKLMQQLNIK